MLFKFYGLKAHKREETGMEYCGIDVHQKYSEICILAEDGEVMERTKVQTTRRALERFFSRNCSTMRSDMRASSPGTARRAPTVYFNGSISAPRSSHSSVKRSTSDLRVSRSAVRRRISASFRVS